MRQYEMNLSLWRFAEIYCVISFVLHCSALVSVLWKPLNPHCSSAPHMRGRESQVAFTELLVLSHVHKHNTMLRSNFFSTEQQHRLHCKYGWTALLPDNESHILHEDWCVEGRALISFIGCPVCCYGYGLTCACVCISCYAGMCVCGCGCVCVCVCVSPSVSTHHYLNNWGGCVCIHTRFLKHDWLCPLCIVSSPVSISTMDHNISTFLCVSVGLQSKSVSSTDSQPTEERQGPSGGYAALQGGAEAKRRRCDDKEALPQHSYVCVSANWCKRVTRCILMSCI